MAALLIFSVNVTAAQNKILPAEANRFVLPGYEMLDYISGDINNDNRPDALLVLRQKGEDSIATESIRPLLIFVRQANGQLKKAVQNDSAILCYHCGGIYGDPYQEISITKNGFDIHFYGGSSWRWSGQYSFSYDPLKNNWFLTREFQMSYHNTEPDETQTETTIEKEELGEVSIGSFNANFNFGQTEWKVTAAKTFFYDNPKKGSKHRKGYLVKGDNVTSYRELKNFVKVYFTNKEERSSSGFILKKDLIKIQ